MAALLHDVAEDCGVPLSEIRELFGSNVEKIVDTVTALSDKEFANHTLTKVQKELLSDAKLQSSMNVPKAEHTKEIIIPMARLAKADHLADVLEDLCFKIEHPKMYEDIEKQYRQLLKDNSMTCQETLNTLEETVSSGYSSRALGKYRRYITGFVHSERPCISIYRQISREALNLKEDLPDLLTKYKIELYDLTFIVSDEIDDEKPGMHPYDVFFQCFDKALSSKGLYLLKYCFTSNKSTGYFLLSDEMDNRYRLFVRTELEYQRFLYGSIVDPDSNFSIDNVNEVEPRDTYNEKIRVFRRDGTAMDIDQGATVLDFAFYIHTDLGLHFDHAIIDESKTKLPLSTRLSEGDLVTIVTNDKVSPDITWFKHVNTSRAKHTLVKYFQKLGY